MCDARLVDPCAYRYEKPMSESEGARGDGHQGSAALLLVLLLFCAVQGLHSVHGLGRPGDEDHLRDLGAIQGILDGNWFGDSVNGGEARWYPPLFPALGAAGVWMSGWPATRLWVSVAPWVNLLTPLTFFLMSSRLLDLPSAAAATLALVLMNGAMPAPWLAASYTPWPFTPNLALPLFFGGVWLVFRRGGGFTRWRDAVLIGSGLGVVFLAHTIPAILLSAMVSVDAFAASGVRARTVLWLATIALVELLWSLPLLGPLVLRYHLQIANADPGLWIDPTAMDALAMLAINVPGVLALIGARLLRRRAPIDRRATVLLATWIGVCVIFLARYYACAAIDDGSAVCRSVVLPGHHFLFYLQAAWACLIGHVIWHCVKGFRLTGSDGRLTACATLGCSLVAALVSWLMLDMIELSPINDDQLDYVLHVAWGCLIAYAIWRVLRSPRRLAGLRGAAVAGAAAAMFAVNAVWVLDSPFDRALRSASQDDGATFDSEAYRWMLASSRPNDLFVTELAVGAPNGAAMTVMAAGRRLVAAPLYHSNPYLNWQERDARRRRYLAAAMQDGPSSDRTLCDLAGEAGPAASAWYLLSDDVDVVATALHAVLKSGHRVLYRLEPRACG
jgi:hypothetical protein